VVGAHRRHSGTVPGVCRLYGALDEGVSVGVTRIGSNAARQCWLTRKPDQAKPDIELSCNSGATRPELRRADDLQGRPREVDSRRT